MGLGLRRSPVFKIPIYRKWKSIFFISFRDFVQVNMWYSQAPCENVKQNLNNSLKKMRMIFILLKQGYETSQAEVYH